MEKILEQVLMELKEIKEGQVKIQVDINAMKEDIEQIKMDGKITKEQTAILTEFKTETFQNISDIKDTLKFLLHKEIETEKEIFALKQIKTK
ncbi:hypothetical protein [Clostridium formicaceticum]|uniref:Uncharacterized protein n=1 Tax=Clostridium formicaceticum TaxID=1497 RepID=A0AAC9RL40_9CLOT|nr:hypothetical protein [Clostridium formicaceticum]AOY77152.1 hypothetical protein BJL90_15630 [Clostridium formicaceticum]ARE87669.1 hypothetical protein CLFO_20690 [Clostridium formicaceticum]